MAFTKDVSYSFFKTITDDKGLSWQYIDELNRYNLFSIDGNLEYVTIIYKSGFEPIGTDITEEDANRTDFETNYQPTANKRLEKLKNQALFSALANRVTPANNKYLLTIFNTTSNRIAIIHEIYVFGWQSAAVTGALLECELRRVSARTAGTTILAFPFDTKFLPPAGIAADTGSTSVSETPNIYRRAFVASEEVILATPNFAMSNSGNNQVFLRSLDHPGIILRQNQGFTVKQVTNSTAGTVSVMIVYSSEVII